MDFVLPRKLSNDSKRRAQVSTSFSPQSTIAGFTLFIKKKIWALSKKCYFSLRTKWWPLPKLK